MTAGGVAEGASLLVVGLFKKLALADYLGLYVDSVYATPWKYGPVPLAAATFAFGWQIYFDFSGYTDMARGIARAMGYRLMLNFNRPYLADSLGDFWRRWHISLSTWFRDYVYVPLGGSRAGKLRTYRNLVLTMLICGLWHGAAWTFVIWGALHAAGQAATRELERSAFYARRVPKLLKQAAVFVFVTFAWIFFRAESVTDAWIIVRRLLLPGEWGRGALEAPFPLAAAGLIAAVWGYQYLSETRVRRVLRPAPVRVGLMVIMLLYLALVGGPAGRPFIYFQF